MPTVRWKDDPKEYMRQYYLENKDRYRERGLEWQRQNKDKVRAIQRKYKYGLTAEAQKALLAQGCQICGDVATHIDHDHVSGMVRGGLCNNCNTGLGMFADDPVRLQRAVSYLGAA